MSNGPLDTILLDRAVNFAVKAHSGTERRGKGYPYIVHLLEATAIVASITPDQELLSAAMLHDTVEDTDVTVEDLRREFGDRIASIVEAESDVRQKGESEEASWHRRKQEAIDRLSSASLDAKIVALGDKLSNMRTIARDYAQQGDDLWELFHVTLKSEHAWHYRGLGRALSELDYTPAYQEFVKLIDEVFGDCAIEPQPIDINDFVLSGGGANGESYVSRKDPTLLLKLYFPGKESQAMNEYRISHRVYDAGIPVPEPGKYVATQDGRHGILFRKIENKISIARAVGDNPDQVERYAAIFARMCKKLHRTYLDTEQFENVKDHYLDLLNESKFFSDEQKRKIADFIHAAPVELTAIHGDLQFGNAIIAGKKNYFIDLGDFCYGHPYFDLGMVYLTCKCQPEEFMKENFHMDNNTADRFWKAFVKAYFGSKKPIHQIENELLPYAALKTLIIERDTGRPMPEFRDLLEKTILS